VRSSRKLPRSEAALAETQSAQSSREERGSQARSEHDIDESLEESFPASDPPSWTVLSQIGRPR
jgi:hypothetical protein